MKTNLMVLALAGEAMAGRISLQSKIRRLKHDNFVLNVRLMEKQFG